MKFKKLFVPYFLWLLLFYSCQSDKKKAYDNANQPKNLEELADTALFKQETFGLNTNNNLDKTNRIFIRNAEIKFKTKNVKVSTEKIEDLTTLYNGFINNSNLQTSVSNVSETPISRDSSIITKSFFVENNIIIKVPNQKLDSFLRDLNSLVLFLDFRNIKAEDVSLQILSNNLQIKRLDKYGNRMTKAIDNNGKKLIETNISEENLLDRQNQQDQVKINKLSLEDQVAYSTINLHIYQEESRYKEIVANLSDYVALRPYHQGLFTRLGIALVDGWYYFEEFLLFLARIWFVIIGGAILIYLFKKHNTKKK